MPCFEEYIQLKNSNFLIKYLLKYVTVFHEWMLIIWILKLLTSWDNYIYKKKFMKLKCSPLKYNCNKVSNHLYTSTSTFFFLFIVIFSQECKFCNKILKIKTFLTNYWIPHKPGKNICLLFVLIKTRNYPDRNDTEKNTW